MNFMQRRTLNRHRWITHGTDWSGQPRRVKWESRRWCEGRDGMAGAQDARPSSIAHNLPSAREPL